MTHAAVVVGRWARRTAPALGAALAAVVCAAVCQGAQPLASETPAAELITPAADRAIERGLDWLVGRQHEDGSFGTGAYRGNVAVTALAGLAFLSSGSTPGRGPRGEQIDRIVDYLLARSQPSGFIIAPEAASHGPMYGHGFATLFLAESYGMSRRAELREKLARAVRLIVNTQNDQGGWRYRPERAEADISVTICEVMALRAARNAGLYVPNETIDRCVEYVRRSQNADGGFRYMIEGGESAFARSAAGLVTLYSAGVYEGPEVDKALRYLMQFKPVPGEVRRESYYYYGHYYAVQATWLAGGDYWNNWYPAVRDELVTRQLGDGSWTSPIDLDYSTAMACIILQVPNQCLPIFLR